jgi:hypothetical protein
MKRRKHEVAMSVAKGPMLRQNGTFACRKPQAIVAVVFSFLNYSDHMALRNTSREMGVLATMSGASCPTMNVDLAGKYADSWVLPTNLWALRTDLLVPSSTNRWSGHVRPLHLRLRGIDESTFDVSTLADQTQLRSLTFEPIGVRGVYSLNYVAAMTSLTYLDVGCDYVGEGYHEPDNHKMLLQTWAQKLPVLETLLAPMVRVQGEWCMPLLTNLSVGIWRPENYFANHARPIVDLRLPLLRSCSFCIDDRDGTIIGSLLTYCPSLRSLSLRGAQPRTTFGAAHQETLCGSLYSSNLTRLNFSRFMLISTTIRRIGTSMPRLEEFALDECRMVCYTTLCGLSQLKLLRDVRLHVQNENAVGDFCLPQMPQCTTLRIQCNCPCIVLTTIPRSYPKLEVLTVVQTGDVAPTRSFGHNACHVSFPALYTLVIEHTALADANMQYLTSISVAPKLKRVVFRGVPCKKANALQTPITLDTPVSIREPPLTFEHTTCDTPPFCMQCITSALP